jgi:hypothetical protein
VDQRPGQFDGRLGEVAGGGHDNSALAGGVGVGGERRAQFDDLCTALSSDASTGSFPVRAKIAFTTAGAIVDVPGSPIPPGSSLLSTMWKPNFVHAIMRRARPYREENPGPGKDVDGELLNSRPELEN